MSNGQVPTHGRNCEIALKCQLGDEFANVIHEWLEIAGTLSTLTYFNISGDISTTTKSAESFAEFGYETALNGIVNATVVFRFDQVEIIRSW